MPTKANRAIGSLDFSDAERRKLARKSRTWRCETCGLIKDLLVHPEDTKYECNQEGTSGEPSTSRVQEGPSAGPTKQTSEKSSNNNSDSKQSDSINNKGSSKPETPINGKPSEQTESAPNEASPNRNSLHIGHTRAPYQEQHSPGVQRMGLSQDMVEPRRAYQPLVLKSIFILLSLLILRRVVMVIQAWLFEHLCFSKNKVYSSSKSLQSSSGFNISRGLKSVLPAGLTSIFDL